MNNDIWSPREEPLRQGEYIVLKTRPDFRVPAKKTMHYFINMRLQRAWALLITNNDYPLGEFTAYVVNEVRYEYAIQNN